MIRIAICDDDPSCDIILLDVIMPLLNGMETAYEIRKEDPSVKILFLTSSPEFAVESIECVEAQNKKVVFYLQHGRHLEVQDALSNCAAALTLENGFFKCHRSYIVSIPNTDHFNSTEVLTRSGLAVPIARGYAKAFRDAYFDYMFQEGVHSR